MQKSAAPRALRRALIALEQHRAAGWPQPSLVIRLALGDAVTGLPAVVAQLLKLSLDPALSSLFSIQLQVHAQPDGVALALGCGEVWVSWEPPKDLEAWLLGDALSALLPSGLVPMVERLKARELIAYQAEHDPLTSALNRRAFERRLAEQLAQDKVFAIALIDVDGFKVLNDHLGHAEGERRLRVVAQRLSAGLGQDGVLARYGGDEFVLLLRVWGDVQRERLITLCRQLAHDEGISLSVGLALRALGPQDDLSAQALMLEADARLYEAKRRGRAQVVFEDGQAVSFV